MYWYKEIRKLVGIVLMSTFETKMTLQKSYLDLGSAVDGG